MSQRMTANEVAERLSVSVTTVKTWADRLGIGDKASSGKRLFDDKDIEALLLAKQLRNDDCGFDTISRKLMTASDFHRPSATFTESQEPSPSVAGGLPALPDAQLLPIVQEMKDLALALSEASYRQGQLEADLRNTQAQADEARQREQAADARTARIEAEADRLRLEAEQAKVEAVELRHRLETEQAKPWWRKLMGS